MDEYAPAFTPQQATALTGVSQGRLARWHAQGLVVPIYTDETKWLGYARLYSLRDLLVLRILAELRDRHSVTLKYLRDTDTYLHNHYTDPWTTLTFYVAGRRVFFEEPTSREIREARAAGHMVMPFALVDVVVPMREKVLAFRSRSPRDYGRLDRNRGVMGGAWVVKGTRIPTSTIWDWYEANYDTAAIKAAYPALHDEDIDAAIAYERETREARKGKHLA